MEDATQIDVPQWAKRVVWYQIFPERFRNGNPNNDPTLDDIQGAYPHDAVSPWQVHPWTSDWYKLQPYEKRNGEDIWYNIQRRRYGGDLEGILQKLDYLKDLGIGAIYLNPVFESPSHHKYDGASYHHIDPNFGPDPVGDRQLVRSETPHDPSTWVWTSADKMMLTLIEEIHNRKMKVILDGVFNHVGLNCWAFQHVLKHQEESQYKDWFHVKSWRDDKNGKEFAYRSWWAIRELPAWRQNRRGLVEGPRDYVCAATKRWMDPNGDGDPADGIDGWRLDVAFEIAHPFWKDWRKLVRSVNPEAYIVGELIDPISVLQPYLEGDEFDAVMNYNFTFVCGEYFVDKTNRIRTSEFDRRLRELREAFPTEVAYVMQNLLGSHDSARLASQIVNRDKLSYRNWPQYHRKSKATNRRYESRKPTIEELHIHKLMAIFQMTYLGAPMIYYGDEVGMWGANDPDCRKPMVWDDLRYEVEVASPSGAKKEAPDSVEFNQDLFEHYKKLVNIRNSYEVFQVGDLQTLVTDDRRELYAFSRNHRAQTAVVVLNNSEQDRTLKIELARGKPFRDLLNGNRPVILNDGQATLSIAPQWACILVKIK